MKAFPILRHNCKTNDLPKFSRCFFSILNDSKGQRLVYKVFLEHICKNHSAYKYKLKWSIVLPEEYSEHNDWMWKKVNVLPFRITKDTRLRLLQYKLIHRILPTNIFLAKIKLVDSPMCSFCESEDETYSHLFYSCPYVSKLIQDISKWISDNTIYNFNFCEATFLLGLPGGHNNVINLLMLLCKQYVYFCRLKKKNVSVVALKAHISFYYSIEKYMYKSNGKLQAFADRWQG